MNISLIHAFVNDQRTAKNIISKNLDIPVNINADEWAKNYTDLRRKYDANPFADIFKIHGYGVEMMINELYIDFDYSIEGREDGFDAWKLFTYLTAGDYDCNTSDDAIHDKLRGWCNKLIKSGKIQKLDNLCYLQ